MLEFERAVLAGLAQPQKVVPARFLYDQRGSELFDEITRLPEYYPTRTEVALLEAHGSAIAAAVGETCALVEFGSGSSAKTPLLLRPLRPRAYLPIDISRDYLEASAAAIARDFPALDVRPIAADFMRPISLPDLGECAMVGFFPGSTIGNLAPGAAVDLLRAMRTTLGDGAAFVIGIDLRKDPAELERAYDDAAGVTAAFNLNLLARINRELGGDIDVAAFSHRARWNEAAGRVEMHLEALRAVRFTVSGVAFAMAAGETIHTENSHKFYLEEGNFLARAGGWEPVARWTDAAERFSLHLWRADGLAMQP